VDAFTYMPINKELYPSIWECCEEIAYDAGYNMSLPQAGTLVVRDTWVNEMATIEETLSGLTKEQRVTFSTGFAEDMDALMENNPAMQRAHFFLHDFFEGPIFGEL